MADFKTVLEDEWFTPLPGKGFKHVFVGEKFVKKGKNMYSGFHNWYQFYILQDLNQISNVQVDSFTNNTKPYFIFMNFQWDNANKKSPSSLYVGTSPAFDFALFSVCFTALYKGPSGGALGNECTCKIHNNTLTLTAFEKPPKSGKICTVYPTKVVADAVSKSLANTVQTACEIEDCCPTTKTIPPTTSDSGGNDDYYYAKRGCFFICYVFYVFFFLTTHNITYSHKTITVKSTLPTRRKGF
ncbi:hypothetical protein OS493_021794 [Desmophyllum pertusum]|uniref:Uridylate-specific endoribonuclease n=1 Tax=Desmophyllum pertusum TaxID=174260 RepID=A0A9X0D2P5_9CNID|nr:hypothetical protein OS493_021794 [Desmophyllum pertusum]